MKEIVEGIEAGEYTVAALDGGAEACDWAYSIGLNRCHGHPELLVVGLDHELAAMLVDLAAAQVADGRLIRPSERLELVDDVFVVATPVDPIWLARGEWFDLGRVIMQTWGAHWPPTLQLVWTDRTGSRPVQPGQREWMLRQPLLSDGDEDVTGYGPRLW